MMTISRLPMGSCSAPGVQRILLLPRPEALVDHRSWRPRGPVLSCRAVAAHASARDGRLAGELGSARTVDYGRTCSSSVALSRNRLDAPSTNESVATAS